MKRTNRILAALLAGVMLLSLIGCICVKKKRTDSSPTAQAGLTSESPAQEATPKATSVPQTTDAPEATSKPVDSRTEEQKAAEAAFLALDEELFLDSVTSEITSLDQWCDDPASFGIDESTVPVTLGEFTAEANDLHTEECAAWLEKLNAIDRNLLPEQLQLAYDTYHRYFENEIASKDLFYCYEPLDEIVGIHLEMPLFFGLYRFKDETDVQNYLELLKDMPRFFGQILTFEQARADRGLFMTEEMLDEILNDLQTIADSGETSYLHGTFREAMEKLDFLTDAQREAYIAENDTLVRTVWIDAYRQLHDGLEALRPKCRARVGTFEQGRESLEYFCWKMKVEASNNRTVEEEIQFLEKCASVLLLSYLSAAQECNQTDLALEKTITTGSLESDEAYLKTLMPQLVPPMPDVEVTYLEIPKELQESFSPAAYLTPSVDGFRENIILTNPKNQDQYSMSDLAHEGFPGHMYQYTYQFDLVNKGELPKFQMLLEGNGYSEAWSTNAEWNIAQINEYDDPNLAIALFAGKYYTVIIASIVSLKVNGQGASLSEIRQYLKSKLLNEEAAPIFYDEAIDKPIYYFKYTAGFCELFDMTSRFHQGDTVEFFKEYLRWGPSYFDLLNERMDAWAKTK